MLQKSCGTQTVKYSFTLGSGNIQQCPNSGTPVDHWHAGKVLVHMSSSGCRGLRSYSRWESNATLVPALAVHRQSPPAPNLTPVLLGHSRCRCTSKITRELRRVGSDLQPARWDPESSAPRAVSCPLPSFCSAFWDPNSDREGKATSHLQEERCL